MSERSKVTLHVVRGDDGTWWIEGSGLDVLRGPYVTRGKARAALQSAKARERLERGTS